MATQRHIQFRLTEIYERSVSDRASIRSLLDKYRSDSDLLITFDFVNIAFISRSAAQQLVLEKKEFLNRKIKFNLINIEFQVNQILELAEHKLTRRVIDIEEKEFENEQEYNSFLLSF